MYSAFHYTLDLRLAVQHSAVYGEQVKVKVEILFSLHDEPVQAC
jgi:hypothetical protein